jgi:hypothetical protein
LIDSVIRGLSSLRSEVHLLQVDLLEGAAFLQGEGGFPAAGAGFGTGGTLFAFVVGREIFPGFAFAVVAVFPGVLLLALFELLPQYGATAVGFHGLACDGILGGIHGVAWSWDCGYSGFPGEVVADLILFLQSSDLVGAVGGGVEFHVVFVGAGVQLSAVAEIQVIGFVDAEAGGVAQVFGVGGGEALELVETGDEGAGLLGGGGSVLHGGFIEPFRELLI